MLGFDQVVGVTLEEARVELLEILEDVGFAASAWQERSIPWSLVTVGAFVWSKSTEVAVALKESGFNETAKDWALTRLSQSHYLNTRRDAAAEVHLVTLTCAAGEGPHSIQAGGFSIKNSNGYVFTNIPDTISLAGPQYPASYPVNLASGGSVQLLMAAEEKGEASFTEDGELGTIVTTLSGVTVTGNARLFNGRDIESNVSLRTRNSLKWSLLSAGLMDDTVEALAREAAPGVDRVVVDSTNPRGAGTLNVWLTGTRGNVGDFEKAAAKEAIQRRILHDPLPRTALELHDSPLQELDITGDLYLRPGFNWTRDVLPAIEARLEAWRRTIPLGGFSYPEPGRIVALNDIEHVIRGTKLGTLEPILTVKLTSPVRDVPVVPFGHVTRGTWTLNPIEVPDSDGEES